MGGRGMIARGRSWGQAILRRMKVAESRGGLGRRLACGALVLGTLALAVPFLMMVAVVETPEGKAFGYGALALIIAPAVAIAFSRWRHAGASLVVSALLFGFVLARAPAGVGEPGSGLSSCFLEPHRFARWSPANLIPELDQIKLEATSFRPLILRLFGEAYAGCVTYQVPVQRELDALPAYRALGSSGMHEGWAEAISKLCGGPNREPRHWYRYVPPHRAGEKLPVVVFFHGFGSNAKHDLWCWKELADQGHFALIEPSIGFGLPVEGEVGIERFLPAWQADPDLDWSRAFVAGLSNGALRAARAAVERPALWRGVVLLSPIAPAVAQCGNKVWRGNAPMEFAPYPPVLAIFGALDGFVSPTYMNLRESQLSARGISFTLKKYDGLDHYVNFRARDRYYRDVVEWMADVLAGRRKSTGS